MSGGVRGGWDLGGVREARKGERGTVSANNINYY